MLLKALEDFPISTTCYLYYSIHEYSNDSARSEPGAPAKCYVAKPESRRDSRVGDFSGGATILFSRGNSPAAIHQSGRRVICLFSDMIINYS